LRNGYRPFVSLAISTWKPSKLCQTGIGKIERCGMVVFLLFENATMRRSVRPAFDVVFPATSSHAQQLSNGDFGIASTKTNPRGT